MALQHRDQVVRRPGKIESFFKCESLEQRQLLTTLHGGEVFEFFDPEDAGTDRDDRRVIRVAIQGQGTIELVGGIIDDQNNLVVAEIPGRILSSPIGRIGDYFGGLGGGVGLEAIGRTPIDDTIHGADGSFPAGEDEVALDGLASNAAGETYAFNIIETEAFGTIVQLVQIDTLTGDATVVHALQDDLPNDVDPDTGIVSSLVTSIPAADFHEDTGILFFVAQATVDDEEAFRLYAMDVTTGVVV